eukprot:TRINITY_DN1881_c0_g1_i1.p1 TRINITY_DN1881_c0_g1~~TRINITY_DN1881_c0_g1_i1.p1  ORF type:complete len:324 (+),score=47.94 TRINITY_DN1881_c0_g1_i1:1-972(+)
MEEAKQLVEERVHVDQNKKSEILEKVLPLLVFLYDNFRTFYPHLRHYYDEAVNFYYTVFVKYHCNFLFRICVGLFMVFYGGKFSLLVSAFEAFRITCYASIKFSVRELYNQAVLAYSALKKDKIDPDPDAPITENIYAFYFDFLLIVKAVDPEHLHHGFSGISKGFFSIILTIQSELAQAIYQGAAFGDTLEAKFNMYLVPFTKRYVSEEYHKYIPLIFHAISKSIGVYIGYIIQKWMHLLHICTKGADVVFHGIIDFLHTNGHITDETTERANQLVGGAVLILSIIGIYKQFVYGSSVPVILSLLLLPIYVLELILAFFVFL